MTLSLLNIMQIWLLLALLCHICLALWQVGCIIQWDQLVPPPVVMAVFSSLLQSAMHGGVVENPLWSNYGPFISHFGSILFPNNSLDHIQLNYILMSVAGVFLQPLFVQRTE